MHKSTFIDKESVMFAKNITLALASTAVTLLLILSPAVSFAGPAEDTALAKKVTEALGPYKSDIVVRALNGAVTLSGTMEPGSGKGDVMQRASNVPGVKKIVDEIVTPAGK